MVKTEVRQPPSRLKKRAKEVWNETAQELADMFGLTSVDYILLERYCQVSAQLESIFASIEGNEQTPIQRSGTRRQHPLASMYVSLMKQQTSYAAQLGIGIAARIKTQRLANTGNGPGTPGSKQKKGNSLVAFAQQPPAAPAS